MRPRKIFKLLPSRKGEGRALDDQFNDLPKEWQMKVWQKLPKFHQWSPSIWFFTGIEAARRETKRLWGGQGEAENISKNWKFEGETDFFGECHWSSRGRVYRSISKHPEVQSIHFCGVWITQPETESLCLRSNHQVQPPPSESTTLVRQPQCGVAWRDSLCRKRFKQLVTWTKELMRGKMMIHINTQVQNTCKKNLGSRSSRHGRRRRDHCQLCWQVKATSWVAMIWYNIRSTDVISYHCIPLTLDGKWFWEHCSSSWKESCWTFSKMVEIWPSADLLWY